MEAEQSLPAWGVRVEMGKLYSKTVKGGVTPRMGSAG